MKVITTAAAIVATVIPGTHHHFWRGCHRRFTERAAERTALRTYAGTRDVSHRELLRLGWRERCQSVPADQPVARRFDRRQAELWRRRRRPSPPVTSGGWSWPWSCIAQHEGFPPGNPATDTGNGYYGGLQFDINTWLRHGGVGMPDDAPIAEQEAVATRVLHDEGWGAWPRSSVACGL